MVDFDSQVVQEDENMPLTPPGPEMRKILEGGGDEEEGKEEIDMGEANNSGDDNLKEEEPKEDEEEVEPDEEVDQDSNDDDNNDDTAQEIPAVLSTSSDHIVYEDDAPEEVNVSSGWESSEGESSSETESEEEEEDVAPYVAAAAAGATTAAAVASANEEEPYDVEVDPTETETAGGNPPESSPKDDFLIEETGEEFNLEESLKEVLPPQDNYDDDEEQQLAAAATGAATAATATKAADDVANTPNDYDEEERQPRKSSSSCCKRHKCLTLFIILMILFVIAAVVLIILFLLGPLKHPVSQEPIDKEGTTPPPGLCNVVDLGPFYKTDCETCLHTVAMDGETGLIARGGEGGSIQFIVEDGTYIPGQTLPLPLPIDHEVSVLSGDYAALGYVGTVYGYEKDSTGVWSNVWNKTQVTTGTKFGTAIAIYEDKMVIGAPGEVNGNSTGAVYVYGRDGEGNWVEEAKLFQTSVPTGSFGSGVALQGDMLVVADGAFPGAVYLYQYGSTTNSWEQSIGGTLSSANCRPVNIAGNSYTKTFEMSVGVTNGEGVLVGCPSEEGYKGTVSYYSPSSDGSGYELKQKITAFNGEAFPTLGKIVVDKGRLLVTTAEESVYVYELGAAGVNDSSWEETAMIAAPGGANDAALSGEQVFLSYGGNTRSYILEC